jgi:hypothetical protein
MKKIMKLIKGRVKFLLTLLFFVKTISMLGEIVNFTINMI